MDGDDTTCIICQSDELFEKPVDSLPCGHIFHRECLKNWEKSSRGAKNKASCPMCRETYFRGNCTLVKLDCVDLRDSGRKDLVKAKANVEDEKIAQDRTKEYWHGIRVGNTDLEKSLAEFRSSNSTRQEECTSELEGIKSKRTKIENYEQKNEDVVSSTGLQNAFSDKNIDTKQMRRNLDAEHSNRVIGFVENDLWESRGEEAILHFFDKFKQRKKKQTMCQRCTKLITTKSEELKTLKIVNFSLEHDFSVEMN